MNVNRVNLLVNGHSRRRVFSPTERSFSFHNQVVLKILLFPNRSFYRYFFIKIYHIPKRVYLLKHSCSRILIYPKKAYKCIFCSENHFIPIEEVDKLFPASPMVIGIPHAVFNLHWHSHSEFAVCFDSLQRSFQFL